MLSTLKDYLKECEVKKQKEKDEFKQAKEYYHANQLPDDVLQIIKSRGQPPQFENIFAMLSDKILGFKSGEDVEVGVIGRQKDDDDLANILGDILKAIFDHKDYQIAQNELDLNLSFGIAVARIWCKDRINLNNNGEKERVISVKSINPKSFFIDPQSVLADASDAEFFHHKMILKKPLAIKYFGKKKIERVKIYKNEYSREYIKIVESWVKDWEKDCWDRYIWCDDEILLTQKCAFKHKKHPYVVQKLKIDHENNAYGFFRNLKPIIDSINYQENRATNMIGSKSVVIESDAVDDLDDFIEQISLDNGVAVVRSGALKENKIQISQINSNLVALNQKTAEKKQSANMIVGFNQEMLGLANNRMSAAAMSQRADAGMVSLSLYLQSARVMLQNIASRCLDFICHYFVKEQVFKIVDKANYTHYFTINESTRENGKAVVKNAIKIGGYDIKLYIKPANNSTREERFKYWSEIIKSFMGTDPQFAMDLMPLMFEDANNSAYRDVVELLAQRKQKEQEQMKIVENSPEAKKIELENKLLEAKIDNISAQAVESLGRADYQFNKKDLQGERTDLDN